jgi:hypothetical protein
MVSLLNLVIANLVGDFICRAGEDTVQTRGVRYLSPYLEDAIFHFCDL